MFSTRPARLRWFVLALALIASVSVGISVGSQGFAPREIFAALSGGSCDPVVRQVVLQIRLPRILLAILAGAGLSVSGAAFQSLLHNPLADPYILGVSSGAAIGAVGCLAIFGATHPLAIGLCAFATSSLVVGLVYVLASRGRGSGAVGDRMLLVGMAISSFAAALLILFLGRSSGNDARTILHWVIGDLGGRSLGEVAIFLPQLSLILILLAALSHRFNLLALDVEVAESMGVDVARTRKAGYLLASFLTASIVSLCGAIGFVGLVIPHVGRRLFSADNRVLFPVSALLGATLMVSADTIGRVAFAPLEVPVGIITALIGAPLFVYILATRREESDHG